MHIEHVICQTTNQLDNIRSPYTSSGLPIAKIRQGIVLVDQRPGLIVSRFSNLNIDMIWIRLSIIRRKSI